MSLSPDKRHIFHFAEIKALGGAGANAGGFQSLIDTIHAIVALYHLAGIGVPLGGTPGACRNTGFASNAKGMVHEDDTILAALLHGTGGTCGDTPRILAVVAGHKDISRARHAADIARAHLQNLTQPRSDGQVFIGLALNFTGAATNTFACILKQIIVTHNSSSIHQIDNTVNTACGWPTIAFPTGCQQPDTLGDKEQLSYQKKEPL
jgi:hypothetical protein